MGTPDDTGPIQLRHAIEDSPVPIPRGDGRRRGRREEESRSLARAGLDRLDDALSKRHGVHLPDQAKELGEEIFGHVLASAVKALRDRESQAEHSQVLPVTDARRQTPSTLVAWATLVGLVAAIMVGSLSLIRISDRVVSIDNAGRERLLALETRFAEAESERIKLAANERADDERIDKTIKDHEDRLRVVEERLTALIVWQTSATDLILRKLRIDPPPLPPTLRIAVAEAESGVASPAR